MKKQSLFSLENKVALVLGGRGKIGFEISRALSENGAKVISASRNKLQEKDKIDLFNSLNIESIELDATDEYQVRKAVKSIEDGYGSIDILVNCTSVRPMKKFMRDTLENWQSSMQINSSALFVPSRIIGDKMAELGSGSIVNISSSYGLNSPPMRLYQDVDFITEPDYPFVKSGGIGFSKYLSSYYAADNVRVNVVAPGGVFNNQPKEFLDKYNEIVPMGRMAETRDIVGAVIYLASDASQYVTGIVLPVDGGWSSI